MGDRKGRAFNRCRREVEFTAHRQPNVKTRVPVVPIVVERGDRGTRIAMVTAGAVVLVGRPMVRFAVRKGHGRRGKTHEQRKHSA